MVHLFVVRPVQVQRLENDVRCLPSDCEIVYDIVGIAVFLRSESFVMSVSINPGATALTVMSRVATSLAIERVNPSIPAFAAQ